MTNQINPGSSQQNKLIRVEGKYAFHRGDMFSSYAQVADRLRAHTNESLVYYWVRDSRLLRVAHTKTARKIDDKLHYYTVKFSCIFGGQRLKSIQVTNAVRPGRKKSRQIDCPAFISLRAAKCGQKLEVIDVCNDHSHEISEQAAKELPQKRRPSQSCLEEIQELLHLNVDKDLIIKYVKQKENKTILKKDLFNMAMHMRMGLRQTRSEDEQTMILHRIKNTTTEDGILQVVFKRFQQIDPVNMNTYKERIKSPQNTFDVFDTSTQSAVDFTSLPPEIDLLNTTECVNDQIEYDELLSNRIVDDYQEESNTMKQEQPSEEDNVVTSNEENYRVFICDDDTGYTYDEMELGEKILHPDDIPDSHFSHNSNDSHLNDLILTSPERPVNSRCTSPSVNEFSERVFEENDEIESRGNLLDESNEASKEKRRKRIKLSGLPKYFAKKSRRVILNCRNCGTNARLIKMQIAYLQQQRNKLFLQTKVLQLKKEKLRADIRSVQES